MEPICIGTKHGADRFLLITFLLNEALRSAQDRYRPNPSLLVRHGRAGGQGVSMVHSFHQ